MTVRSKTETAAGDALSRLGRSPALSTELLQFLRVKRAHPNDAGPSSTIDDLWHLMLLNTDVAATVHKHLGIVVPHSTSSAADPPRAKMLRRLFTLNELRRAGYSPCEDFWRDSGVVLSRVAVLTAAGGHTGRWAYVAREGRATTAEPEVVAFVQQRFCARGEKLEVLEVPAPAPAKRRRGAPAPANGEAGAAPAAAGARPAAVPAAAPAAPAPAAAPAASALGTKGSAAAAAAAVAAAAAAAAAFGNEWTAVVPAKRRRGAPAPANAGGGAVAGAAAAPPPAASVAGSSAASRPQSKRPRGGWRGSGGTCAEFEARLEAEAAAAAPAAATAAAAPGTVRRAVVPAQRRLEPDLDDDAEAEAEAEAGHAVKATPSIDVAQDDRFGITVRSPNGSQVICRVRSGTTVAAVVSAYCQRESISEESIKMMCDGRRCRVSDTVGDLVMQEQAGWWLDACVEQTGC
ncbi:hypothetical protein FOA52_006092 [Chlamydomonas sp. UWO 241]|nr:hypothetical protein FOA52_006092 [Chlamydomonas sp. UWO 241]